MPECQKLPEESFSRLEAEIYADAPTKELHSAGRSR